MGRPKQAIISKEAVFKVALEIINTEGLAALNVRRIANSIGVNAASLYNHFSSKDEIIAGAAELALEQTPFRLPVTKKSDWQDLLFAGVLQERDFLLAHPELLSIIVRRRSEGFASNYLEQVSIRLLDLGVPMEILDPIYDALESYTIGHVSKIIAAKSAQTSNTLPNKPVLLTEIENKRFIDNEETYKIAVLSIISTIKLQYTLGKHKF